jgi:hypothetical protein
MKTAKARPMAPKDQAQIRMWAPDHAVAAGAPPFALFEVSGVDGLGQIPRGALCQRTREQRLRFVGLAGAGRHASRTSAGIEPVDAEAGAVYAHLLQNAGNAGTLEERLDHLGLALIGGKGDADQILFLAGVHWQWSPYPPIPAAGGAVGSSDSAPGFSRAM